jgi:hypothetical protein
VSPHQKEALSVCLDVAGLDSDAAVLDSIARLALDLKRSGYRLRLRNASRELIELIELSGLSRTLPTEPVTPGSTGPRC